MSEYSGINNVSNVEIFREYREQTRAKLETILAALILPFMLLAVSKQAYLFVLLQFVLFSLCLSSALSYRLKKTRLFPISIIFLTATLLLVYGIAQYGAYIAYWVYPFLVVNHIYTPRDIAKYTLPAIIGSVIVTSIIYLEPELYVRLIATILLLYMYTTIMINVISKQQKSLASLATIDTLTGAFNRNQMQSSFDSARERFQRGTMPVSLVYIDIDHFKTVNDNYGHEIGDRVLIDFVKLIKSRLRKVDDVFRMGGEEFIVLLTDTSLNGALQFANDLLQQIEKHEFVDKLNVTASMGVAEFQKEQTVDEWIKSADTQLYMAKNNGRNCVMPRQ